MGRTCVSTFAGYISHTYTIDYPGSNIVIIGSLCMCNWVHCVILTRIDLALRDHRANTVWWADVFPLLPSTHNTKSRGSPGQLGSCILGPLGGQWSPKDTPISSMFIHLSKNCTWNDTCMPVLPCTYPYSQLNLHTPIA